MERSILSTGPGVVYAADGPPISTCKKIQLNRKENRHVGSFGKYLLHAATPQCASPAAAKGNFRSASAAVFFSKMLPLVHSFLVSCSSSLEFVT